MISPALRFHKLPSLWEASLPFVLIKCLIVGWPELLGSHVAYKTKTNIDLAQSSSPYVISKFTMTFIINTVASDSLLIRPCIFCCTACWHHENVALELLPGIAHLSQNAQRRTEKNPGYLLLPVPYSDGLAILLSAGADSAARNIASLSLVELSVPGVLASGSERRIENNNRSYN